MILPSGVTRRMSGRPMTPSCLDRPAWWSVSILTSTQRSSRAATSRAGKSGLPFFARRAPFGAEIQDDWLVFYLRSRQRVVEQWRTLWQSIERRRRFFRSTRNDLRRIACFFDRCDQQGGVSLRRIVSHQKLIAVKQHFDLMNSFKPFQGLFDLLRSSHSDRAALALVEPVNVNPRGLQLQVLR